METNNQESNESLLIAAHNERNLELISSFLDNEGYRTTESSELEELGQKIERANYIDLALIDVSGFGKRIWDFCEKLRKRGVPFLTIFPERAAGSREKGEVRGSRGILVKPLSKKRLTKLLEVLLQDDYGQDTGSSKE